jgi:hypothetical protein
VLGGPCPSPLLSFCLPHLNIHTPAGSLDPIPSNTSQTPPTTASSTRYSAARVPTHLNNLRTTPPAANKCMRDRILDE